MFSKIPRMRVSPNLSCLPRCFLYASIKSPLQSHFEDGAGAGPRQPQPDEFDLVWHLFGITDGPLLSRCCVAESDVWLVCRFCSFASAVRRNTFFPFCLLAGVHSEVEKIIHWPRFC